MGLTSGGTSPELGPAFNLSIDVNLAVSKPDEALSELLRLIPGWGEVRWRLQMQSRGIFYKFKRPNLFTLRLVFLRFFKAVTDNQARDKTT
jgi:hypothetical protein